MARYTGPRDKINRRFGQPIFGASKALERRNFPPGVHGAKGRRKQSDYAIALGEKQKMKFGYGLLEKQFRRVYHKAMQSRGVTGEKMLQILETRLDTVVDRLGFSSTRRGARQMVTHGHINVNGRRVSIPSYSCRPGDVVEVRDNPKSRQLGTRGLEATQIRPLVDWLSLNKDAFKGTLTRIPTREELTPVANEQLVVELYSRS
ncbi:MAG: 30S ribosomal protein S4 [Verrucomicrobia bacterium]|nr:30S ribosomal protein S4 [Verrucomicrobiota bacterium]NBU68817.1 30S ribosomal protein S4 [Verrucomicrobiota bacterium]NDB99824.1 30S ribosomal protein S4 [Verrucomicrobiota bacterium]NDF17288.1 30S ribosomal protein S4 [Verrucomicrobiota bacterium]